MCSTLAAVVPEAPRSPRNERGFGRKYANSRVGNKRARYQAFSDGTVINLNTGRAIRGSLTPRGYLQLPTGEMKHRLIARQLIENPEHKTEVNHKNGIKADNRTDNLEWTTPAENKEHYNTVLKPARTLAAMLHPCPHCACPQCNAVRLLLSVHHLPTLEYSHSAV